jgi:MFS family permease
MAGAAVDADPEATARPKSFLQKLREIGYAPRELWIIYSIKLAESTAYFAFSYIYAPYLSEVFGYSDIEAGMLYAYYGVLCSVFGLIAGPVIDAIDLRTALLVGTLPSFIARLGSALTSDPNYVALCSVSALPLGAAFGLPVFALGVRRFTHPENRAFAFTIFYAVLCAASAFGGLVISFSRSFFHEGIHVPWPLSLISPVSHLGWMRVNVLLCSAFTFYTCAAACFVRNARVQQNGAPRPALPPSLSLGIPPAARMLRANDPPPRPTHRLLGLVASPRLHSAPRAGKARAHPAHLLWAASLLGGEEASRRALHPRRVRRFRLLAPTHRIAHRGAGHARDVPPPGRHLPKVLYAHLRGGRAV